MAPPEAERLPGNAENLKGLGLKEEMREGEEEDNDEIVEKEEKEEDDDEDLVVVVEEEKFRANFAIVLMFACRAASMIKRSEIIRRRGGPSARCPRKEERIRFCWGGGAHWVGGVLEIWG
eukprot:767309-Hanusia_phi.AAC.9